MKQKQKKQRKFGKTDQKTTKKSSPQFDDTKLK